MGISWIFYGYQAIAILKFCEFIWFLVLWDAYIYGVGAIRRLKGYRERMPSLALCCTKAGSCECDTQMHSSILFPFSEVFILQFPGEENCVGRCIWSLFQEGNWPQTAITHFTSFSWFNVDFPVKFWTFSIECATRAEKLKNMFNRVWPVFNGGTWEICWPV